MLTMFTDASSDSDSAAAPSAPSRPAATKPAAKSKWDGEDEEDKNVAVCA